MNPRKVNVSFANRAALAGMEAGLCHALKIERVEYHDHLVFLSMLQAGVKRFNIVGGLPSKNDMFFLNDKADFLPHNEYMEIHRKIELIVENNTLNGKPDYTLVNFLTELIYCLKTKSSFVSALSLPVISDYTGKISLELYSLVNGLVRSVNPIDIDLPIPKLEVAKSSVDIFKDVYFSDSFDRYSRSHELLESSDGGVSDISKEIMNNGKKLYKKFDTALDVKNVAIKILPSVSKIVDAIFGSVSGSFADAILGVISDKISSDKKITIYDYRRLHLDMLREHYFARAGLNSDLNPNKL